MEVKEIVKQWLIENNYDGLRNDECGCSITDFMPCGGDYISRCMAGHVVNGCDCGEGHDFHVLEGKIDES